MLTDRNPRTNKLLTALLLAGTCAGLTPAVLAQSAGTAEGAGQTSARQAAADPAARATALMESGRLIEAKNLLDRTMRSARTDTDRSRLLSLMKAADGKIRAADPVEVSLQRAEFGVMEGDLLAAERWAKAVSGKPLVKEPEQRRAAAVLEQVEARRGEVRPLVPGMVEAAKRDFEAGRYGAAKAGILGVLRSGVELDPEVAQALENHQLRIVELEQERGANFDVTADAAMGMMGDDQPGQVRRPGGDQPPPPSTPPSDPPAGQPGDPGPGPEPDPAPMPPPSPAPAPTPDAPPSSAPAQEDLIRAAMRAEAQRIIAEADQAYESARYSEAADKYDVAVRQFRGYLNPDELSHAQRRLDEARVRLGSNAPGRLAEDVRVGADLQRQQAIAEFENEFSQARARLDAADADLANASVASARLAINRARDRFTPAEFDEYSRRLTEMEREIGTKRTEITEAARLRREADAVRDADRAVEVRLTERDRRVNESIDRIRALQQEQQYDEALQVVDQVLFLDPGNPSGLLLRDLLQDITIYRDYNEIQKRKQYRGARQSLESEEAIIPPIDVMEYPLDWPTKTLQRGELSAFADAPENRRVLSELASKRLPADFTENKLEDVFTYIQQLTQVNMDIDWESLEAMNVRRDTPITLKLSALPVQTLLDRVLTKATPDAFSRAGWTVSDGVLTVASQDELNKNRTLIVYNINDLLFEIPDYPEVPQIDLTSVLQQGEGGGQSPFTGDQATDRELPDEQERIQEIVDIIQQNVDFDGWRDNGGETGTLQELNGNLIITNTPRNHREIVGLLSKLREIRNMQINVETKFLLVNQSWFEQVGFDLDIVINANNNQVRAARGVDPAVQAGDFFDFGQSGTGLRRTLPGQAAFDANGDGDTTDPGEAASRGQPVVNPRGWSPVAAFQNSLGLTSSLAAASVQDDSVTAQVLRTSPALGIAGQFLDDVQVDFLIQATQADRRTVQLTAPRLTFTNGQIANIFVVTQQAFVSDLEPVVGDSAVGFDPTVNAASEGVTLLVEGVISSDRRYVTMNIDAGVARIDGFAQQAVSAVAGGQLVNSADTQSFIQLPTITVTRVRTTATVPDEGTLLLGGQRLVTEVEIETGVPVLSKIPIINRFFTNRIESKEEQTLLILVKPTVLIQSEQEESKFPGLLDSMRTGISGR